MHTITQEKWELLPASFTIEDITSLEKRLKEVRYGDIKFRKYERQIHTGSYVGYIVHNQHTIKIKPKVESLPVLYMVLYSKSAKKELEPLFESFSKDKVDANWNLSSLINIFRLELEKLISNGLKYGYISYDETCRNFRGKLRCTDQIRKHLNSINLLEVTIDEFTEDILENQILKTAVHFINRHLSKIALKSDFSRLQHLDQHIDASLLDISHSNNIPEVVYDHLNIQYKEAISIAKIILQSYSEEEHCGSILGWNFLISFDNKYEEFIRLKLQEGLDSTKYSLRKITERDQVYLDTTQKHNVKIDIAVKNKRLGKFVAIADAKYKVLRRNAAKSEDIYQMHSYLEAMKVEKGLLIYASSNISEPSESSPLL